MIVNIEDEIYNAVYDGCSALAKVIKGSPKIAPSFPCVTFKEIINNTHDQSVDSSGEFANNITYEINIFSKSETPISECAEIRSAVDSVMSGMYRMRRTTSEPVDNYADKSIYRYVIRYDCIVDKNNKIYGR